MASLHTCKNEMSLNHIEFPIYANHIEPKPTQGTKENNVESSQRAQWLRAAVSGANDWFVSVTLQMMGVGAVNEDITQLEIEVAQMKREREVNNNNEKDVGDENDKVPNPFQAAIASAFRAIVNNQRLPKHLIMSYDPFI